MAPYHAKPTSREQSRTIIDSRQLFLYLNTIATTKVTQQSATGTSLFHLTRYTLHPTYSTASHRATSELHPTAFEMQPQTKHT